jgi:hypothetical protein
MLPNPWCLFSKSNKVTRSGGERLPKFLTGRRGAYSSACRYGTEHRCYGTELSVGEGNPLCGVDPGFGGNNDGALQPSRLVNDTVIFTS